jgi:hypothetical protein
VAGQRAEKARFRGREEADVGAEGRIEREEEGQREEGQREQVPIQRKQVQIEREAVVLASTGCIAHQY